MMALKEACSRPPTRRFISRCINSSIVPRISIQQRQASTASPVTDINELEPAGPFQTSSDIDSNFDPVAQSRGRSRQLPSSRYKFRPPRYYRGPLHPHQPPHPSDPSSREFIPGPFTLPRYVQTYQDTIAADLMTLSYQHYPPGFVAPPPAPRFRAWDDSSPYHKNRPLRPPRGKSVRFVQKPITFRNIPQLTGITVHSMLNNYDSQNVRVAGMILQTITGVRYESRVAKKDIQQWNLKKGEIVSVVSHMTGEDMWHFLAKLVDVVMPRIKEWQGVKGSSGDDQGNISFGMGPDEMVYFPEIEMNYEAYPPKLIPGCHVTFKTSANSDKHARLLLSALGVPFYGKMVNS